MSMISKMKSMLGVEEFDEEFDDFAEGEELEENDIEDEIEPIIQGKKNNGSKVVNIHSTSSPKVNITKPLSYEEAREISDALKNRRIVVINTTGMEIRVAQRVLDFVSGSCYALGGTIQDIEKGVYLVSPSNVEVTSELKNEISSKAIFNFSK